MLRSGKGLGFLRLSTAIVLTILVTSCSGDDEPEPGSGSATARSGSGSAIGAPVMPAACAAPSATCALAAEFLPMVERMDATEIAGSMVAQTLVCPVALPPDSPDVALQALAGVCAAKPLQDGVQVYEFNNGKGPFYFGDLDLFRQQVAIVLTATLRGNASASVYAVGCGKASLDLPPDCDRHAVVVYRSDSGLHLGLVFSRTNAGWQIEKVWTPFPGLIPLGETAATVEMTTLSEVKLLDLILFEP